MFEIGSFKFANIPIKQILISRKPRFVLRFEKRQRRGDKDMRNDSFFGLGQLEFK